MADEGTEEVQIYQSMKLITKTFSFVCYFTINVVYFQNILWVEPLF